jgi:hypothetical protein
MKRGWLAASLVLLCAALAFAAGLLFQPPPARAVRLPNGTVVSLEAVTDTGGRTLWDRRTLWQRLTERQSRALPMQLGLLAGWANVRAQGPLLTLKVSGPPPPGPSLHYTLTDEHGCWFRRADHYAVLTDRTLMLLDLAPRRAQTLSVQVRSTRGGVLLGSLPFPNPLTGKYPEWQPEALPVTRRSGPLAVTLTRVMHREQGDYFRSGLVLRASPGWQPVAVLASDATGNRVASRIRQVNADGIVWFSGLCRKESAWKLRVTFRNGNAQQTVEFLGAP